MYNECVGKYESCMKSIGKQIYLPTEWMENEMKSMGKAVQEWGKEWWSEANGKYEKGWLME